jgi:IS4 transposase
VVYADREFYAADVFSALERRNLFYVIPAIARDRLKRKISRFDTLKNGFEDDERDVELHVEKDYAVTGNLKGHSTRTKVYTNIVVLPPDDDSDIDGPQPFATNLAVDDEIRLDRVQTVEKIQRYDYRGGIETSYRSIKECSAWTTSHSFEVRWFHFAFGCMIYNMWLLVDLLTQARIGQLGTRTKPRITLQRFLDSLDRQLSKRIAVE